MSNLEYIHQSLEQGLQKLPQHMRRAAFDYVIHGQPVGSFLEAVISNDLFKAVGKADSENQAHIVNWCSFFYNNTPSGCYGSHENYLEWCLKNGAEGIWGDKANAAA